MNKNAACFVILYVKRRNEVKPLSLTVPRRALKRAAFALSLLLFILPALPSCAANADTGAIRVLLTKAALTDQARVSLDGSYTLGSMSFQRGSHLLFSCESGSIVMYYEGMALDCGNQVTLTRHAAVSGAENGLRIGDSFYLHPGDLTLTIRDGSLRAVLTAPIEEYLLGVVPYEMSDSFPLEALKAQAIAARTYALRKKQASSTDYDVVDNTNDQCYNGILAENKNAAQAVAETAGQCGYYKNALAECFYSASNGGQTELVRHVWGAGDYGYMTMADDPYDLENTASMARRFTLPKQLKENSDLGALGEMLLGAVTEQMEALGYDGDRENIRILSIDRLEATTPRYTDSPSRLMTRLRFTLTVQGKKAADGTTEEDVSMFAVPVQTQTPSADEWVTASTPVEAELNIFPDVEAACGLDINRGTDNELVSVEETADAYVIVSRRYGHGVGMSQRGAQTMAQNYGKSCEEILRFYYPGMTVRTLDTGFTLPSPVADAFLATPGPAATPTPRPTAVPLTLIPGNGEYLVTVTNIAQNSYLNLRAEASTASSVVRQLYYGQRLIVQAEEGDWLKVRMDDASGYVMTQFVEKVETAAP